MALTWSERLKYNLYLWYFSWTKVRLIHYCRPKIYDITSINFFPKIRFYQQSLSKTLDQMFFP